MTVANLAQKRHQLRKLRGETAYQDATPARLHLATLLGAGWSLRSIAGETSVPATTLSKIHRGQQHTARPDTIARVLALKPDQIATRTNAATAEPFVPRTGTTRRLQALLYMGWGHKQLRDHTGINTANLLHQQGRWVTKTTHDTIAAAYRDLSHRRGPSSKAATYARQLGYAGPLAWNDIDHDPSIDATSGTARFWDAEHEEDSSYLLSEFAHLTSCGVTPERAAQQLGKTLGAIEKARERARAKAATA